MSPLAAGQAPAGSGPASPIETDSDRRGLLLLRHAEGGAAAARGHHVGVADLEAGALQVLFVVDLRAAHEGQALAVDEQPQPVALEHHIPGPLLIKGELVLKARAASPAHAHAQARNARA